MEKVLFTILLVILTVNSGAAQDIQDPQIEARMNEAMARARVLAAEKSSPVTAQQCMADVSRWEAMDASDDKTKADAPNFWYEKLSTEELLRLTVESRNCITIIIPFRNLIRMLQFYSHQEEFNLELRSRAQSILNDHGLYHEYLLAISH